MLQSGVAIILIHLVNLRNHIYVMLDEQIYFHEVNITMSYVMLNEQILLNIQILLMTVEVLSSFYLSNFLFRIIFNLYFVPDS